MIDMALNQVLLCLLAFLAVAVTIGAYVFVVVR